MGETRLAALALSVRCPRCKRDTEVRAADLALPIISTWTLRPPAALHGLREEGIAHRLPRAGRLGALGPLEGLAAPGAVVRAHDPR
jgi:hypothetical protein